MSMSNEIGPCVGLWGRIFGHCFKARYDEQIDYPPHIVESMQASLDKAMADGVSLAFDSLEYITKGYRQLDINRSVYVKDVCTRCGQVANRSETSKSPTDVNKALMDSLKTTMALGDQAAKAMNFPTPQPQPQPAAPLPPSPPRVVAVPAGVRVVSATPENVAKMMNQPPGAAGSPVKATPGRGPK